MVIQERDRSILHSLSHFGILSSTQVMALHFKGIAHTTMMKRLRLLADEHLIIRVMGLPKSECAWSLSKKGADAINADSPNSYTNQNTVVHEVELTSVRMALESIGLGHEFTSEQTMRRGEHARESRKLTDKSTIPDGLFIADSNGGFVSVALEIELHPKNHARYEKVFRDYAQKNSISYVWYIVGDSGIGNTVIHQWNKVSRYRDSPKLLVSKLSEIKLNSEETLIYNEQGVKRKIADVFKTQPNLLSEIKNSTPTPTQGVSIS